MKHRRMLATHCTHVAQGHEYARSDDAPRDDLGSALAGGVRLRSPGASCVISTCDVWGLCTRAATCRACAKGQHEHAVRCFTGEGGNRSASEVRGQQVPWAGVVMVSSLDAHGGRGRKRRGQQGCPRLCGDCAQGLSKQPPLLRQHGNAGSARTRATALLGRGIRCPYSCAHSCPPSSLSPFFILASTWRQKTKRENYHVP